MLTDVLTFVTLETFCIDLECFLQLLHLLQLLVDVLPQILGEKYQSRLGHVIKYHDFTADMWHVFCMCTRTEGTKAIRTLYW